MKKIIMILGLLMLLATVIMAATTKVYYFRILSTDYVANGGIRIGNSTPNITYTIHGHNDGTYHYFVVEVTGANAAALGQWLNNDILPYAGDYIDTVEITKSSSEWLSWVATPTP